MKTPKASTTTPADLCPVADFNQRVSAVAVNPPIRVNTAEKPRMNRTIGSKGRRSVSFGACPPVTSER